MVVSIYMHDLNARLYVLSLGKMLLAFEDSD